MMYSGRQLRVFLLVAALMLANLPWQPSAASSSVARQQIAEPRYFPETGHYLVGSFRDYWESHGGLFVFGLPVTSQFAFPSTDGGIYLVQYFERAVFEYHPENPPPYDVLLTQLGRERATGRAAHPAFQPVAPVNDGVLTYFPETSHHVGPLFSAHWKRFGALPIFGYPLSETFTERNEVDGKDYLVQYFERARFEFHPEHTGTDYLVAVGQLGRERLDRVGVPEQARAMERTPPTAPLGTAAQAIPSGYSATGYPFLKGPHVGIGIQAQFYGQSHGRLYGMVRDLGLSWIKQQITWRDIEREKGTYYWGELDPIATYLADQGANVMLTTVRSPAWAVPNGKVGDDGTPRNPQDYGDFMRALAQHYKGKVRAYQLWNEPNLAGEVGGRIDPGAYVELVKAGYLAVKSVDPEAIVVLGSLASTGINDPQVAMEDTVYLERLYEYQGGIIRHYFDVMASHPYGLANPPATLWSEGKPGPTDKFYDHDSFYFRRFEAHRRIMVQHGDGDKQLWLTEWGWGSDKRPGGHVAFNEIDEQLRAKYTIDAITMMRQDYPYLGVTFLWNLNFSVLIPPGLDPARYDPALYAIVNGDYSPRPVYYALKALPK